MTIQVAVIQMVSGADVEANLEQAAGLLARAADAGAKLAVLPENVACMTSDMERLHALAEREGKGPIQAALARMAHDHGLWLVAGTLPLRTDEGRLTNTTLVFDAQGRKVARYDKIHLFDVSVPGGESHQESAHFAPGREVVVLDTPVGRLGLAICYDLRFPELFRAMAMQGMELIALPAAFTHVTGRAHWEVLLRARAIENQCFLLASAQGGLHFPGRQTFGHSQIIGPWGEVLACHPEGSGLALATLDRNAQRKLRERFPVLAHRVL
ncbi:MAG: carbon-nitrogen hydrolase family protein [Halothiobacillaceae bacterium]